MTKAAIETMTLSLAGELGRRGITLNAIPPGWTETDGTARARQNEELVHSVINQTALGRLGTT
jgi:3-oxoacyl-[acyl-carrier protein] reductase